MIRRDVALAVEIAFNDIRVGVVACTQPICSAPVHIARSRWSLL